MGVSESVIGTWLKRSGHSPVIVPKAAVVNGPPRRFDNSPEPVPGGLKAALNQLGAERVDLFRVHRRKLVQPVKEVAALMREPVATGKIGGHGLSEMFSGTPRRALAVHPVRAVQNEHSL